MTPRLDFGYLSWYLTYLSTSAFCNFSLCLTFLLFLPVNDHKSCSLPSQLSYHGFVVLHLIIYGLSSEE